MIALSLIWSLCAMPFEDIQPVCSPINTAWPLQAAFGELGEETWCDDPFGQRWEEYPEDMDVIAVCRAIGGALVMRVPDEEAADDAIQVVGLRDNLRVNLDNHALIVQLRAMEAGTGNNTSRIGIEIFPYDQPGRDASIPIVEGGGLILPRVEIFAAHEDGFGHYTRFNWRASDGPGGGMAGGDSSSFPGDSWVRMEVVRSGDPATTEIHVWFSDHCEEWAAVPDYVVDSSWIEDDSYASAWIRIYAITEGPGTDYEGQRAHTSGLFIATLPEPEPES